MANKITNKPFVICFDARYWNAENSLSWPAERKQKFLYRDDIDRPISVDRYVTDPVDQDSDAKYPGYTGPFSPFWENLDELMQFCNTSNINPDEVLVLAFSIDVSVLTGEELNYWNKLLGNKAVSLPGDKLFDGLAKPSQVQENWNFLGYDVADSGFTSAISNMGFTAEDDIVALRNLWGPCLNSYHLFDQANDAVRFKKFSNARVKEHAPFNVFGVWSTNRKII